MKGRSSSWQGETRSTRQPRAFQLRQYLMTPPLRALALVAIACLLSGYSAPALPARPHGYAVVAELSAGRGALAGSDFGSAVALSNGTAAIGAAGAKRLYIFSQVDGHWRHVATFSGPGAFTGTLFGNGVAISGNTIAVAAPAMSPTERRAGNVVLFSRNAGHWTESSIFRGRDGPFGTFVAMSGGVLAVSDTKCVYIYTKAVTGWRQSTIVPTPATTSGIPDIVSVSGHMVAFGDPSYDRGLGRVIVLSKTGTGWVATADLSPPRPRYGQQFGSDLSISGDRLAVSTYPTGGRATVYPFTKRGRSWVPAGALLPPNTSLTNASAITGGIALYKTTLSFGTLNTAVTSTGIPYAYGAAYIFEHSSTGWHQQQRVVSGGRTFDEFGSAIALDGNDLVVGAPNIDRARGRVFVFERP